MRRGEVLIIQNENPNVIIWLVKLIVIRLFPFIFFIFLTINIYRYNQNIIIDVYFYVSIIQGKNYNCHLCSYCLQDFFVVVIMKLCFYNYIYIFLPVHRICDSHWSDVIITSGLIWPQTQYVPQVKIFPLGLINMLVFFPPNKLQW